MSMHPPLPARCLLSVIVLTSAVMLSSCSTSARMIQDRPDGGMVAYPITDENDILSSPGRTEALALINQKCRSGYRVTRQGETSRINPNIDRVWRGQVGSERLWGVEFRCNEESTGSGSTAP